ncbi:MAG: hypothetical protein Q7U47_01080 [Paludibacter sp.]|nr:hypothetical protein [Paludibacter sp.]
MTKEELKAHRAKWYSENKEKVKAATAKWRAENPEKYKMFQVKKMFSIKYDIPISEIPPKIIELMKKKVTNLLLKKQLKNN